MKITTSLKKVMFISFINHRFFSAKVVNFAHWLARRGHDVTVVCAVPPTHPPDTLVRYIPLPIGEQAKLFRYINHILLLLPIAQRADWIIGVNDPGIILGSVLSHLGCGKFLMAMAQEHTNLEPGNLSHTIVTRAYRSASIITEVSDEGAAYRQERMGLQKSQIVRFMNVPPRDSFKPHVRREKPDGEPLSLVYTGGIAKGNALDYLIEAMKYVEGYATLQIYGFGDAGYIGYLTRLIEENQLQSIVTIHDDAVERSKLQHILHEADVGVVLYSGEFQRNCPNKMFEYIAAGLPVLVSQSISNLSWLQQYNVGVYVDPVNPQSIAAGIRAFLEPGAVERMSRAAIHAHQKEWNLEHESDRVYAAVDAAWHVQARKMRKKSPVQS
jgi:glycosyltransferase involved in cell wall biosynthesis